MSNITIPKKLDPIIQAFYSESPKAAKQLVIQAAKAIYGSEEEKDPFDYSLKQQHVVTNEDIENICAFMQGFKPTDMLEAILAAQAVVTHMLGMRKLSSGLAEDQRLGLKMLQLSSESMGRLQKKRCGGVQNINIHYHGMKATANPITIPVESLEE